MSKVHELSGQRFGSYVVLTRNGSQNGRAMWLCRCDCGSIKTVLGHNLVSGHARSCGCINKRNEKHGFAFRGKRERLYIVWLSMKNRVLNPNSRTYKYYGGRGIKICDEWKNNYLIFREWAYSNGYDEKALRGKCTIDRIDVNGNYCPENCRWVDQSVQVKNSRPRNKRKQ